MANLTNNKKQSKHFEVAISHTTSSIVNGKKTLSFTDLTICGVGYKFPNEEPDNKYGFDIDEVFYFDKKLQTLVQIPINVVEAIYGTDSIKEIDHIYTPIMEHMSYLFSSEYDKEMSARNFDNTLNDAA